MKDLLTRFQQACRALAIGEINMSPAEAQIALLRQDANEVPELVEQ